MSAHQHLRFVIRAPPIKGYFIEELGQGRGVTGEAREAAGEAAGTTK
ncbi:MAG: hypothetical protein AB7U29_01470 [Desulfobulbus sp.]